MTSGNPNECDSRLDMNNGLANQIASQLHSVDRKVCSQVASKTAIGIDSLRKL